MSFYIGVSNNSVEEIKLLLKKYSIEISKIRKCTCNCSLIAIKATRRRPRIVLYCDRPNWAYDHRAQELVKCLEDEYELSVKYVVEHPKLRSRQFEILVVFFWG